MNQHGPLFQILSNNNSIYKGLYSRMVQKPQQHDIFSMKLLYNILSFQTSLTSAPVSGTFQDLFVQTFLVATSPLTYKLYQIYCIPLLTYAGRICSSINKHNKEEILGEQRQSKMMKKQEVCFLLIQYYNRGRKTVQPK